MVSAVQSSLHVSDSGVPPVAAFEQLSYSQQLLLSAVTVIQNLRDEEDVQNLLFLAEEFGALRANPFYFSVQRADDRALPSSLVLRDALRLLMDSGVIRQVDGRLSAQRFSQQGAAMISHPALTVWLAARTPAERSALAEAVLELRAQGATMRARAAVAPFRQALNRVLGVEAAEVLEHRLDTLRWHLAGA